MKQKSRFKFLPWPGFEPRTSQSNGHKGHHSTTAHPRAEVVLCGSWLPDRWFLSDTLLNVFLAIAVDNLANAQELTAAEQEQEQKDEQVNV